ncbi:MAG: PEGA domain-containing protein, partial [bacterium]|nr:PEGA domain-containing protein [bacterium]
MEKLPGKISLTAHQVKRPEVIIDGAAVTLDGKEIGKTPVKEISVKAGLRQLVIQAPKYKELKTQVT